MESTHTPSTNILSQEPQQPFTMMFQGKISQETPLPLPSLLKKIAHSPQAHLTQSAEISTTTLITRFPTKTTVRLIQSSPPSLLLKTRKISTPKIWLRMAQESTQISRATSKPTSPQKLSSREKLLRKNTGLLARTRSPARGFGLCRKEGRAVM